MAIRNWKHYSTLIIIMVFFCFTGMESSMVFPTLLKNLQQYGSRTYLLGIVISTFYMSQMLATFVFGLWLDWKPRHLRVIIATANLLNVAGSLLYMIGAGEFVILGSRVLSGAGSGLMSVFYAHIARVVPVERRTSDTSIVMLSRYIGMLLGPVVCLGMRDREFWLGFLKINEFNFPGLISFVVWVLVTASFGCMFFNQTSRSDGDDGGEGNGRVLAIVESGTAERDGFPPGGTNRDSGRADGDDDGRVMKGTVKGSPKQETQRPKVSSSQQQLVAAAPRNPDRTGRFAKRTTRHSPRRLLRYLSDEAEATGCKKLLQGLTLPVVVLLMLKFQLLFSQMSLETLITPVSQKLLNFGTYENSLVYFSGGVEFALCFLLVHFISRCVSDRVLLVGGMLMFMVGAVWGLLFFNDDTQLFGNVLFRFAFGIFLLILGIPFVSTTQSSLYSKLTPREGQGFFQGIFQNSGCLGSILGPLLATSISSSVYVIFGVTLLLQAFCLVLFLIVYRRLAIRPPPEGATGV